MKITLLTKQQKGDELGITYRSMDKRLKKDKLVYISVGKSKRKYFLPKLTTMQLLEFCFDHNHVGDPCICRKFIDEIKARQNKESTIL